MARTTLSSMCRSCRNNFLQAQKSRILPFQAIRLFTSATSTHADPPLRNRNPLLDDQDAKEPDTSIFEEALAPKSQSPKRQQKQQQQQRQQQQSAYLPSSKPSSPSSSPQNFATRLTSLAASATAEASTRPSSITSPDEPYHLNIYSHKHNTHITFTEPSRNPILSYSAGNIGLRKAQRGSYDAAYQLTTYTMRKMIEKQWRVGGKTAPSTNRMMTLNEAEVKERGIEVVLRGYGPGREAFQKALLGVEGKILKGLVKRVTDGTRLKFGGTRSPAVRRLG